MSLFLRVHWAVIICKALGQELLGLEETEKKKKRKETQPLSSKDFLIESVRHDDNLSTEDGCGGGSGWRDFLRVEGTFSVFPVRALVLAQEGGRRESTEICFEIPSLRCSH